MFDGKCSNLERLITGFSTCSASILKHEMIDIVERTYTMTKLNKGGNTFENDPHARYATNICLQQSNRSSGNMKETGP